ncbi:S41 family peptidase [Parasphingorhabdus sp. DH2-15]|uniref:S41 family peptidase n=1 Tax=Parasphingorhabdus sp. DH2-15 TaxID=3444112 RepID=UPI003F688378
MVFSRHFRSNLLSATLLVTGVAMIPASTAALSAVDARSYDGMEEFFTVMSRVRSDYVEDVDDEKLLRGAIDGMLASLDPHSSFLDARDFENLRTQTEGTYGGIGLSVVAEEGAVKVVAPTRDTPADRAGIKSGDFITHIDGRFIVGGTLDDAVDAMRGAPGTSLNLTIVRPGRDQPFDVDITREIIDLKPVRWEIQNNIGVIGISSFTADVGNDLIRAMKDIESSLGGKPDGYVLDLRSNPGGLLDEAVSVSDVFLDRGEIVSQRGRRRGDTERFFARPGDYARNLPVIVLVDSGSASASEIVAGALKDHNRALIMGETSFGKGSVQTLLPLSRTTALKLTTARYFTPSGRSVQEGGITPDITVPQLSDPDYKTRIKLRESDLRGHLVNESSVDDAVLEDDEIKDPRFSLTLEQLEAKGIEDFQLHYALETIARTTEASARLAGLNPEPSARN